MKINFRGTHDVDEAVRNIVGMLELFRERYGIEALDNVSLDMRLLNNNGEEVDIVNADTQERYEVFDVYKKMADSKKTSLHLIVDNTRSH